MKDLHKYCLWCCILAAAFAGGSLRGATELGPAGEVVGDVADESNRFLGGVYKDEAAGVAIAPPAGARIITRQGLELVSFVHEARQWGGSVQSITMKDKMSITEYMRASVAELGKNFKGVQVVDSKELAWNKLPAGRLTTTLETEIPVGPAPRNGGKRLTEKVALFRQDLIVQTGDIQFILLTMYAPLKDRADAQRTYEAMLKTFVIMDKKEVAARRYAAVEAGRKWLAQRTAEELKSKLQPAPQMFQVKVGGKPIGYMRFDEVEGERDNSKGILLAVSSRIWPPDGTALSSKNTAYWRYSRDDKGLRQGYCTWENATRVVKKLSPQELRTVAEKAAKGERDPNVVGDSYVYWFKESGVLMEEGNTRLDEATLRELQKEREELIKRSSLTASQLPPEIQPVQKVSHMIVTWEGDPMQGFAQANKGTDVRIPADRPAVLPKNLEYLWTRVIDLGKPTEMTFWVYNSATRKLANRTLSVVGPARVSVDGKLVDCTKCTDEMDSAGTTLWVDSTGKILKMLTSDQSMLEPTTEEKMLQLWADKLK